MTPTVNPTRFSAQVPAQLSVATELKRSGTSIAQDLGIYPLNSVAPLTSTAPAFVTVEHSDSRCINYNTTKVSVTVTIPCDPTVTAIETAKQFASAKAQEYLQQEKEIVGGTFEGEREVTAPAQVSPPPLRPILIASSGRPLPPPPANPPPRGILRAL